MGNVVGNLSQGELVMVLGRMLERVGQDMHDGKFADGVQLDEITKHVSSTFTDAWAEYQDVD